MALRKLNIFKTTNIPSFYFPINYEKITLGDPIQISNYFKRHIGH